MAGRLSFCERTRLEAMLMADEEVVDIAKALDRAPSTIRREIKRSGCGDAYDAEAAQAVAHKAARRPKRPKLACDRRLAKAVHGGLKKRWSPHAIAADLRKEGVRVCAETIYKACYDRTGRSGLPAGSYKLLPRQRQRRKPRSRSCVKHQPLGDFRPVSDRCVAAKERSEAGHWEGDLIIGKNNKTAVVTLVERVSRFVITAPLPNGHDTASTTAAVIAALKRQPSHMVKTLTWDQGREMTHWHKIEAATGAKVYFCEPRSPWQRPSNEQANGLLRRWLPKGTKLPTSPIPLALIEDHLNHMPRKLHGWLSAQTIYNQLCCNYQ